jgi:hypothetical protein
MRSLLLLVMLMLFAGCRAAPLLPPSMLSGSTQNTERSSAISPAMAGRQEEGARQIGPSTIPRDTVSSRRPGASVAALKGPGSSSLNPIDLLAEEAIEEWEASDDLEIRRTEQALKRFVADRQGKRETKAMEESAEEVGPIALSFSDDDDDDDVTEVAIQAPPHEVVVRRESDVLPAGGEASSRSPASVQAASHAQPLDSLAARTMVPMSASYDDVTSDLSLEDHFRAILEKLNSSDSNLSPRESARRAAAARLVSLAEGELADALQDIPGLDDREQHYFKHQIQALYNFLDANGSPDQRRRSSLVMLDERKALEELAAISALEVNQLAFCTEVMGFGVVTTFPASNFKPNQEVLLYCELDNFVSEKVGAGYETRLDGSYEILDAAGKKVFNDNLPEDSHICRSRRRDYFIAYRLYMPSRIEPGKYTLKLTIHDIKGNKYGQADVPFQIVL